MTHDPADGIRRFFAYARERQAILLRRRAGRPGPWTEDGILQQFRFCNVHREDDTTTIWLRENVRERVLREDLLLATVLFRWFNRIRTGEAIWNQPDLLGGDTAWFMFQTELAMNNGRVDQGHGCSATDPLHQAIATFCGPGPYVTGSYIIKTPDGYDKLNGVLQCIRWFVDQRHEMTGITSQASPEGPDYHEVSAMLVSGEGNISAEMLWGWLRRFPYLGDFMAYEIVTDLDQTFRFTDRLGWANPGPGATRGLGRVFQGRLDYFRANQKQVLNTLMQALLAESRKPENWPQERGPSGFDPLGSLEAHQNYRHQTDSLPPDGTMLWGWPAWDMRTVEHTLCEFDKYERVRTGEGRPRQVFRP